MTNNLARAGVVLLALLACSCAGPRGGPPRGMGGPGGPEGMQGGRFSGALLFVSPMGEPFRVGSAGESAIDLWFNGADTDHNGALSADEFRMDALRYFVRLDANQDRAATSSESTAIYQREAPEVLAPFARGGGGPAMGGRRRPPGGGPGGRPPEGGGRGRGGPGGPPGGGGGPGGGGFGADTGPMLQGAQRFGLLGFVEPVMSCDTDLSFLVSVEEFNSCIAARFVMLDSDHDGAFQRSEAKFYRETAMARREQR